MRHQGAYTCLASTPYISINRTAMMRVKVPPKWLIKPSNKVAITWPTFTTADSMLNHQPLLSGTHHLDGNVHHHLVRFDCLASGNPMPVIRWKFLRAKRGQSSNNSPLLMNGGSSDGQMESIPILSNPQIYVLENGSLLIRSIDQSKYEGVYVCEVSNGVGKPLEARASLTIYHTPMLQIKVIIPPSTLGSNDKQSTPTATTPTDHHHHHHQNADQVIQLAIRYHSQVSLSCTGTGAVPLFIGWYKNGHEISTIYDNAAITMTNSFRIFESNSATGSKTQQQRGQYTINNLDPSKQLGERTANMVLKRVTRSDTGEYVCLTKNSFGMAYRIVMLHVLESPDAPESLKAIDVGSRTVTLTWAIGYTGNLPLLSQNIEYKKEAGKKGAFKILIN